MLTINKALLYVKNYEECNNESLKTYLHNQPGISDVYPSWCSNGLIFIDYQPSAASLTDIVHDMARQGMSARIVGL